MGVSPRQIGQASSTEATLLHNILKQIQRLTGVISSYSGGFVWGQGTGTLSNQTDLQTALNLKANLATRVQSTTSTTTLTPNIDLYDMAVITAQAATLAIAAPTGTPSNGNGFIFRIKDDGTARAITFNAIYRAIGSALPTTTTISKTLYFAAVFNSTDTKWDVFPSNLEI